MGQAERPTCPHCGAHLILALPPGGKGPRTFQCFECERPDPLKSDEVSGWLRGELGRGDNTLKFSDTIREPSERKRDKRGGSETPDLRGGLTHRITTDAYRKYGEPL